jgi:hypothetical protein
MTKDQAKLLLSVCRPCGADDNEPLMKEARDCVEADARLKAQFQSRRQWDSVVSEKVCCCSVPKDLLNEILTGARLSQRAPSFWNKHGRWLAVAAAVVITSSLFFNHAPQPVSAGPVAQLVEFRDDSVRSFQGMQQAALGFTPAFMTSSAKDAQRFFAASSTPVGSLPNEGVMACRVSEWRGQRVAICCLSKGGQKAHMFIVPASAIQDGAAEIERVIANSAGYPVTVWREGDSVRALVGESPDTKLEPFLAMVH